jgi:O-antigen ligase
MAFFLPATIALHQSTKGFWKGISALGALVSVVGLLMSVSRGAYLAALLGAVLGAVYLRKMLSPATVVKAALGAGLVVVIALVAIIATDFGVLISERLFGVGQDAYHVSSGRSEIWRRAFGDMLDSPVTFLTGFGWDAYSQIVNRLDTHSLYVFLVFNLGFIGLCLYLITASRVLIDVKNALGSVDPEFIPFLVAFICGFFSLLIALAFNELQVAWIYVWAYAGIILRLTLDSRSVESVPSTLRTDQEGIGIKRLPG